MNIYVKTPPASTVLGYERKDEKANEKTGSNLFPKITVHGHPEQIIFNCSLSVFMLKFPLGLPVSLHT